MLRNWFICLTTTMILSGCEWMIPPAPADDGILDGPVAGLSSAESARFLAGDIAFNDEIFTAETGLGPIFVATSCGSCHPGDGKGHPFTTLTRYGQTDTHGNTYIGKGGPQLQNRALPGFIPETMPAGIPFSKLTPPANTGLGFLAALTDAQILSNADKDDSNGDGISGVPNLVDPPAYFRPGPQHQAINGRYIGRFGKKAAVIDLLQQTVNAYNQDMGITSVYEYIDPLTHLEVSPEVDENTIHNVVFYLRTLKAPVPRRSASATGSGVFTTIGCGSCHIPQWTTPDSDVTALSNKTFFPYTDLLLHDMGPALDDGYTEGTAETYEWRTPPLWGLGLSPNSQGGQYYLMHDGRARTIEQAIEMHGGEATVSRERFASLSREDKDALIKFLESL